MRGGLVMAALAMLTTGPAVAAAKAAPAATASAAAAPAIIQQGKAVYGQWCAGCHAPLPGFGRFPPAGTAVLQQRYQGSVAAVLEDRKDLTPQLVRAVVRKGVAIMPALRKTEVTDAELDAVVAYLVRRPPAR